MAAADAPVSAGPQLDRDTRVRMLLGPQAEVLQKRLNDLAAERMTQQSKLDSLDGLIADITADLAILHGMIPAAPPSRP